MFIIMSEKSMEGRGMLFGFAINALLEIKWYYSLGLFIGSCILSYSIVNIPNFLRIPHKCEYRQTSISYPDQEFGVNCNNILGKALPNFYWRDKK